MLTDKNNRPFSQAIETILCLSLLNHLYLRVMQEHFFIMEMMLQQKYIHITMQSCNKTNTCHYFCFYKFGKSFVNNAIAIYQMYIIIQLHIGDRIRSLLLLWICIIYLPDIKHMSNILHMWESWAISDVATSISTAKLLKYDGNSKQTDESNIPFPGATVMLFNWRFWWALVLLSRWMDSVKLDADISVEHISCIFRMGNREK